MSVSHWTRDIDTTATERAMSTTRAARARLARREDEHVLQQEGLNAASGPAFVPFQLSDEMYANIVRYPARYGYPVIDAGVVRSPKFGYLFIERRTAGQRRPKLVDGLDWVPSSAANASTRILQDGVTELVRYYCARRTKSDVAKPHVKPYVVFQRSVYEDFKNANPRATTYDIKSAVGERWRSMTDAQKQPFKIEAQRTNRQLRRRMSSADPEQLLVRHEMWLQTARPFSTSAVPSYNSPAAAAAAAAVAGVHPPTLVLVHYLGDDAYQCLTVPPRPIIVNDTATPVPEPVDGPTGLRAQPPLLCHPVSRVSHAIGTDTVSSVQQTATTQLQLLCVPATPVVLPVAPARLSAEFVDRMPHAPDELTWSSSLSPESPPEDEPVAIPVVQASPRSAGMFSGSPGMGIDESPDEASAQGLTDVSAVMHEPPELPARDDACLGTAPQASPQMDDSEGVDGFFNGAFEWL